MPNFNRMLLQPNIATDLAAGAFSGLADNTSASGLDDKAAEPFVAHSLATGQPTTELPRQGLGALLGKVGILSPTMKPTTHTMDLETLALQHKKQMENAEQQDALEHFAGMVRQIGGEAALAIAPQFFPHLIIDDKFRNAIAHIKATNDINEERVQNLQRHQEEMDRINEIGKDIQQQRADTQQQRVDDLERKGGEKRGRDYITDSLNKSFIDRNNPDGFWTLTPEGQNAYVNTLRSTGDYAMALDAARNADELSKPKPRTWGDTFRDLNKDIGGYFGASAGAARSGATPPPAPAPTSKGKGKKATMHPSDIAPGPGPRGLFSGIFTSPTPKAASTPKVPW